MRAVPNGFFVAIFVCVTRLVVNSACCRDIVLSA